MTVKICYHLKKIDDTTEWFLVHNEQTWKSYLNYNEKLAEMQTWKKQRYADEGIHYKEDMFRRLGNKTIQTALELGKPMEESKKHTKSKCESLNGIDF